MLKKKLALGVLLSAVAGGGALAQGAPAQPAPATEPKVSAAFDKAVNAPSVWYFSWGYSRQQYAQSDIHVSQPNLGNDFTVRRANAKDFPTSFEGTINDLLSLNFTNPQENVRIGKFMDEDQTFAIELNIDHTKYNTDHNQNAEVDGTINGQPYSGTMNLNSQTFDYNLHNGLNHIMLNAVWLKNLRGPKKQPGDLRLISRLGAGILLPHADNTIFGKQNQVGPKNENVCCFSRGDWWQINGWTAGVEVGLRYTFYKSLYLEATQKIAYGELRGVPVYEGSAEQKIWMSEQVVSLGFLF